jgi:predicted transcriptional regulator
MSGSDTAAVLSDEERKLLDLLVSCGAARTPAQLSAGCGLEREQVAQALDSLRAKGLVTRLNTVVESYTARFPGVEV